MLPSNPELTRTVEDLDTAGLDSRWFSEDKTQEEVDKTRTILKNSQIQFRLLKTILKREFDTKQLQPTDLDKINFDQRRVYNEGYLRALQVIYKILP